MTTPGPEMKRLDVLVGTWQTEGEVRANPPEPAMRISGTDRYEWLAGGFFLLHWVDVQIGDEKIEAIEIIGGYDAASGSYPMRSFDNGGNTATMYARVGEDGGWTFADESTRATLVVSDDRNAMTATWERCDDGTNWLPWMDMTFTKLR